MKGEISEKILGAIIDCGMATTSVVIDAFFDYHNRGRRRSSKVIQARIMPDAKERNRVRAVIYKLKNEGCLQAIDQEWKVTKLGLEKFKKLLAVSSNRLPDANYEIVKAGEVTIIIFDIPEDSSHKRQWLRSALKNLKFFMLQRSVWVGRVRIPAEFLEDIKNLNLQDYVQIISLDKLNSFTRLTESR
ncbi:MAG: CRISPR-associated endonuclease Cas2 [Candidatus Colwellbacteria bacterium RIFCSPLOWO2_01_FULL_48_10]|uniref:CRISPR-associated endonuclease Cas2 n=1 Tax=Candidatus Colwellbacteria bacterium RIFCSPLOWO2_01_FULL_48_10 TaxID=1797690 RepID=A0A1G1Z626_9BACT|nr:MAG: CRISPR-associated endonuclease Cas2 [Candidatus Colwellbacteria bacterium RIFCSPLOWO2_01_FULL_48_10]